MFKSIMYDSDVWNSLDGIDLAHIVLRYATKVEI
jgi:hypothetical protein